MSGDVPHADLPAVAAAAGTTGSVWSVSTSADLQANLVRLPAGARIARHRNDELDVLLVRVRGHAVVTVDGRPFDVAAGTALLVPRGSERAVDAGPADAAYLSVHRRRVGGIPLSVPAGEPGGS